MARGEGTLEVSLFYLSRGRCKVAVVSDLLQAPLSSVVRLFAKTLKMYICGRELNNEVGVGFDIKVYRCAAARERAGGHAKSLRCIRIARQHASATRGEKGLRWTNPSLNNQRVRRGLQGRKQRDGVSASVWPILVRTSLGELVVGGRSSVCLQNSAEIAIQPRRYGAVRATVRKAAFTAVTLRQGAAHVDYNARKSDGGVHACVSRAQVGGNTRPSFSRPQALVSPPKCIGGVQTTQRPARSPRTADYRVQ